eukprot:1040714-Pyramimonas_sp.AAC.1
MLGHRQHFGHMPGLAASPACAASRPHRPTSLDRRMDPSVPRIHPSGARDESGCDVACAGWSGCNWGAPPCVGEAGTCHQTNERSAQGYPGSNGGCELAEHSYVHNMRGSSS